MSEQTASAVLRILSIACVVIGLILTFQAVVGAFAMKSAASNLGGVGVSINTGGLTFWAVISKLAVSVVGLILFQLSPALAERVVA